MVYFFAFVGLIIVLILISGIVSIIMALIFPLLLIFTGLALVVWMSKDYAAIEDVEKED